MAKFGRKQKPLHVTPDRQDPKIVPATPAVPVPAEPVKTPVPA